jgi:GNAT superfamily N-acetyltransferase
MKDISTRPLELTFAPLVPERWDDLAALFGKNGACGGCWCMWWRVTGAEYNRGRGEPNRLLMRLIVDSGEIPGILAYEGRRAVGWCSIGPRERFGRLERSPVLKRIDEEPVWSVVCFFVEKSIRRMGVNAALLRAAVDYARTQDARIVEGYPAHCSTTRKADSAVYMGALSTFLEAGFVEAGRGRAGRPIVRHTIR